MDYIKIFTNPKYENYIIKLHFKDKVYDHRFSYFPIETLYEKVKKIKFVNSRFIRVYV